MQLNPTRFCAFATSGNHAGPIQAGQLWCDKGEKYRKRITANMLEQIEFIGQPYSTGEPGPDRGESVVGMRLMLGSDVTQMSMRRKDGSSYTSPTTWLLPANLTQFDPSCDILEYPTYQNPDAFNAISDKCALLGKAQSCSFGCGLDPSRETLWAGLDYPLDYPASAWQVADKSIWEDFWGNIKAMAPRANDHFTLLEKPLNEWGAGYPFVGFAGGLPFLIVNHTVSTDMMNLAFPGSENTNDQCNDFRYVSGRTSQ